ncbi:glutaconyl-CoA decarboxylase subunit beta [Anopheles sinensis]|uniref:Glutaconyl-CoA decarboxylase subunit beta n=1 Tax=Anopheles sinensis TaxID=74873 RepID=A0A084WKC8_ANOSI|nr:glutaconyl-CoA decarboxylase subunit beta [Anopheles sinensis]
MIWDSRTVPSVDKQTLPSRSEDRYRFVQTVLFDAGVSSIFITGREKHRRTGEAVGTTLRVALRAYFRLQKLKPPNACQGTAVVAVASGPIEGRVVEKESRKSSPGTGSLIHAVS